VKSELVKPTHLARKALVYVRQSTPHQVISNQESLRLQYALQQRARELGWHEADIDVIDSDLGLSGASAVQRSGFKELVGRVGLSEVGLILSIDVTRLARNCFRLVSIVGHMRAAQLPHRRPGWCLRSGKCQWPPAPRSQGHHIGVGVAHHPQPPHRRPFGQGRAWRAGADPADRPCSRTPAVLSSGILMWRCRNGLSWCSKPS